MKKTSEIINELFNTRKDYVETTSFKRANIINAGLQQLFGVKYPSCSVIRTKSKAIIKADSDIDQFHFYYDGMNKRMRIEFKQLS